MACKKFFILFLIASAIELSAQDIHYFREGLFLTAPMRYGREAIVTDAVAHQLFTGTFKPPVEGDAFEGGSSWRKVEADSAFAFHGSWLEEGYLYLAYASDKRQNALLHVMGHNMLFVNGAPYAGDVYNAGYVYSPVALHKGVNHILIRCSRWARSQGVRAKLIFPKKDIFISVEDPTLPHIVLDNEDNDYMGGIVIVNATQTQATHLSVESELEGYPAVAPVPAIPSMSTRKVRFNFSAGGVREKGTYTCALRLRQKDRVVDEKTIPIEAVDPGEHYSAAFISGIDGSVQYYAVAPQAGGNPGPALFLSVHGAGVEAIGQARAYQPKDWGILVAPTNRRPRGFNWEDWGRLDAMEVFEIARQKFQPDPKRIYLTGHSMGGHGTWHLGAAYPDKWAAIAPCAAYPTLSGYGSSDGKIPVESGNELEKILLQSSSPSNVFALAKNYLAHGVYVHHGDSDEVVSVDYSRQMRKVLGEFHPDFAYYEHPGGSHWFGSESVDWPPLFDFFKHHALKEDSMVNRISFTTASPAISSTNRWIGVLQQRHSFRYSSIDVTRDIQARAIRGNTGNIAALSISLDQFKPGDTVRIELDGASLEVVIRTPRDTVFLKNKNGWTLGDKPSPHEKGIYRNGSFKEPFNHRMIFVYGTSGTKEENRVNFEKARYDAQVWYYRGNGAVDLIADKEFRAEKFKDRGVILYGNASNNSAWNELLAGSPVFVRRGSVKVGSREYKGDDLAAFFMWPRKDSHIASVAAVAGSGITGMRAAEANQYFAGGSGFPDFFVFSVDMLKNGLGGIKCAGFYANDWQIDPQNSAFNDGTDISTQEKAEAK